MSCLGEGKPKMNRFCDFFLFIFFFLQHEIYTLFIFLNGAIVFGVGEALCVLFFCFLFGFFFLEEDDKTNLQLIMLN